MPNITVDGVEYNTEDLSENGKAQLASLQFLEVQMKNIKSELAVYQTARNTYMRALQAELEEWMSIRNNMFRNSTSSGSNLVKV